MVAFKPELWSDLFVAAAGASAALAGLVFVAVSINIERILKFAGLPERALVTLLLLLNVLVVSLLGLVPRQSAHDFGLVVLVDGIVLTVVVGYFLVRSWPKGDEESHILSAIALVVPGTVPFIIAGISLLNESGGGVDWVLTGFVGAVIGAGLNAWVLLVEILR